VTISLVSAKGQILLFQIDFDGRSYNTLTLPCERVITLPRIPRHFPHSCLQLVYRYHYLSSRECMSE